MAAVTVVSVGGKVQCRPDRRWYHERPKIAFEAMEAGMPVYVRSDGRVAKARANAALTAAAVGLTATKVAAGDPVTIIMLGSMTGWSGLTPGTYLYVSAATAGVLDTAAPAGGGGNYLAPVAFCWTASEIEVLCPVRLPTAIA